MIKVWTDNNPAGVLARHEERGSTFAYTPGVSASRAVSVTMPVQISSFDSSFGLAPIFEMNLPEGALRERLRLAFAKATGTFDDFDLLTIVGRSQLGRIRYTGMDDELDESVPFQSIDEILTSRRGAEFYRYLVERFAKLSGISGVQPKVLVRDDARFASEHGGSRRELSPSFRGATHIVKFWDPAEFPQLATNEFFCLKAAERCGLPVPPHRLAADGSSLVVDRFDLRADGTYCGFEDFCVLNGRRTDEKYKGSYESSIVKRFQQFARSADVVAESAQLFALIALNFAVRNGDAHLKNFGMVYDDVEGEAHLAPAYDIVTTTVYLPKDRMALTLNGKNLWPSSKDLIRLAEGRSIASRTKALEILEEVSDALSDTAKDLRHYIREHPEFSEVGERMLAEWELGRSGFFKG